MLLQGATEVFTLAVDVSVMATEETVALDASFQGTLATSMAPVVDNTAGVRGGAFLFGDIVRE